MCGRFTLKAPLATLQKAFPQFSFAQASATAVPRFNVAPTQQVLGVANDSPAEAGFFRWGLIPSWAQDAKIASRLINARDDGVATKPAFRSAFKRRHCLIFADGFYEWETVGPKKTKLPLYFQVRGGAPFAFAGRWEVWTPPEGEPVRSCTLITTSANELLRPYHDRMPAILLGAELESWLNSAGQPPEEALRLIRPLPSEELTLTRVSTRVNSVAHEGPELLTPG